MEKGRLCCVVLCCVVGSWGEGVRDRRKRRVRCCDAAMLQCDARACVGLCARRARIGFALGLCDCVVGVVGVVGVVVGRA